MSDVLDLETARETVRYGLSTRAYEHRDPPVTLRSGEQSNHYVDCRKVLGDPNFRSWAAQLAHAALALRGIRYDAVAGVVLGGVPFALAVSDLTGAPAMFVRPAPKEHGLQRRVEGVFSPHQRVVLFEDVFTTGASAIEALGALAEIEVVPVAVVALVDRRRNKSEPPVAPFGCPAFGLFSLEDILDPDRLHAMTKRGV